MVPLLLLLLLPEASSKQGCLHISDSNIKFETTDVDIIDEKFGWMSCNVNDTTCFVNCTITVNNQTWTNGSSFCYKVIIANLVHNNTENGTCTVYPCIKHTVLRLIRFLGSDNAGQKEMMQLFSLKHFCKQLFGSNPGVKKAFLKAEAVMIHNMIATTQLGNNAYVCNNLKDLSMNVVNISKVISSPENESRIQIEAPELLDYSFVPEIWMPVDDLLAIPTHKRIIGVVSYTSPSQFQFEEEDISSMVIRLEMLGGTHLQNLNTSIKMLFKVSDHTDMGNDSKFECRYFDENDFCWRTDGCETSNFTKPDIVCLCNHSTAFAVLLIRDPIPNKIHWEILSYISYIGCGLSAFFTALSLVIYVFSRNHSLDYSISIHVSLSGALFLLNSTFLLTEWGATVKPDWVCVFVAALMHYSLLCCFTWMAIEALHLYLLLIRVFNTYYKHYLVKLSLAGWGIPGIIVGVSLAVKDFKQFYGITRLTVSDTNQTNAICWITDDSFFYSLNLVYFTLIFIFNSGILMAVASSICRMKQVFRSNSKASAGVQGKTSVKFTTSCRSGLTVLGITCLMGTTWGLAFLGSGYTNYPILYLFCILNSLQGFFIFLWICLSVNKQKKRKMDDRMTTPMKTSTTKSD